jgi:mRNA-degrading endonuclease RelE of RelBE toxin-antitoxin system
VATLPGELPGTVRISDLGDSIKLPVYKVKHFRCSDLKGKGSRSGIRIIYTFIRNKNKIVLIQIYFKGDNQDNHDKERILKYCDRNDKYQENKKNNG